MVTRISWKYLGDECGQQFGYKPPKQDQKFQGKISQDGEGMKVKTRYEPAVPKMSERVPASKIA